MLSRRGWFWLSFVLLFAITICSVWNIEPNRGVANPEPTQTPYIVYLEITSPPYVLIWGCDGEVSHPVTPEPPRKYHTCNANSIPVFNAPNGTRELYRLPKDKPVRIYDFDANRTGWAMIGIGEWVDVKFLCW